MEKESSVSAETKREQEANDGEMLSMQRQSSIGQMQQVAEYGPRKENGDIKEGW